MPGEVFVLGEQKVRPDVYVRWHNAGGSRVVTGTVGVAAAVVKSNWGPLGKVITIEAPGNIKRQIGTGNGPDAVNEIFNGGAITVNAVRAGTGGDAATLTLKDTATTPADVVTLTTKYPTSRAFKVTVRDSLQDATVRELLVLEGTTQLERITFAKGADEPDGIVAAVNAGSDYLTAAKVADGNGTLAAISDQALAGGTDPTIVGSDYTDAFVYLENKFFDTIIVDSEDATVHASLHSFVDRMINDGGGRIIGVVGEPTSVEFETRKTNAKALNDFAMVYVGNGFSTAAGDIEGAKAAGRVAGMIASSSYKASLTHEAVTGSIGVTGDMTNTQYKEAVQSGMLTFSLNPQGLAQIDYGINTKVSLSAEEDEGWKKIRRVRTRFELIDRAVFTLHPYLGKWDNSEDGRAFVVTIVNGIIGVMTRDGALESGELIVDPDNVPVGDSAWFKFVDLVDLDSIEKVYLDFGFQFARQSA